MEEKAFLSAEEEIQARPAVTVKSSTSKDGASEEYRSMNFNAADPSLSTVWMEGASAEIDEQFVEDLKEKAKEYASKASVIGKAAAKTLEKNLGQVTKEVSEVTGKFFSSWFGYSEPAAAEASESEQPAAPAEEEHDNELFHVRFPDIPADEALIEGQPCSLLQTYRAINNSSTPELPIALKGILYITENFCCVYINDETHKLKIPIIIPMLEIKTIQHSKKVENKIRLVINDAQNFILKDFIPQEFDKALGILKHMWESSQQPTGTTPEPDTQTPPPG